MLIVFDVKSFVAVPSKLYSIFKTAKAIYDLKVTWKVYIAFVGTDSHCGISIRSEYIVIWLEDRPRFFCCLAFYNDHEGAHKVRCICLLCIISRSIVIDFVFRKFR
jgi:hypothetical protein